MTDQGSPTCRTRVRVLRSGLAGALLVPLLALGLVIAGPMAPAYSYASPPAPVTIGPAAKTVVPRMLGLTTPWGLALNAVGVGFVAYQERDSWLPVLKGALGMNDPATEYGPSIQHTGCIIGIASGALNERGTGENADGYVRLVTGNAGSCSSTRFTETFTCSSGFGAYTSGVNTVVGSTSGASGITIERRPCTTGFVTSYRVSEWPGYFKTREFFMQGQIPESDFKQSTDVTCKRPDGTTFTRSESITGPQAVNGINIPSCMDSDPTSIPDVVIIKAGPNGGHQREILRMDTKQDVKDEYGDCFGPSGLQCTIRVFFAGEPCAVGDAGCTDWFTRSQTKPGQYQCRFGPYVVGMGQCDILKPAYRVTGTVTKTTPSGEPDLENPTDPKNPPNPDPDPDPNPSPTPTPTPAPPTTGPNPEAPPTNPDQETDPNSRNCLGDMWSWNPVSWVFVPVKCAMIWAFVPTTGLAARVDSIKAEMTTKIPFSWFSEFAAIPSIALGDGCPVDWRINVGAFSKNVVCDSSYTQAIRAGRPVFAGMMILLACWPMLRSIAYASFPVIKPTPTSGGR